MKIKKSYIIVIVILTLIGAGIMSVSIFNINKKEQNTIDVVAKEIKYKIFVDVTESKLYVLENGKTYKTYRCSGGKWSTPSPIGSWKVISKDTWGEGFRRTLVRNQCALGTVWNTWNTRNIFSWVGKFAWMY